MGIRSYRDLKVWQDAIELTTQVYALARQLPSQERFGLVSQMQRAAVSVAANIAEGHARSSTKEFLRFLSIARGSLAELETHLILTERLGFCNRSEVHGMFQRADGINRMLAGLRKSLKAKIARNK